MRTQTNSSIRTYRRCAREYFYSYAEGVRTIETEEALRFGSLAHHGLEAWWSAQGDERLPAAIEALRGRVVDDYDLARAGVMLQGYDARWRDDRYEVLAVEAEFRVPVINPATGAVSRTFELGGKLDVLVRDLGNGRVKLIEHKTTSEDITPGSDYWKRLRLDSQVSAYFRGAESGGHQIDECIYDVLGKPALRPGSVPLLDAHGSKIVLDRNGDRVRTKAGKWRETGSSAEGYVLQTRPETPDEFRRRLAAHVADQPERYYERGTVVRIETEMLDADADVWATTRMIRESELAYRWPRNVDACIRFGRTCPYFRVCTGEADIDDATLFRRVDNVHEELSSSRPKEEVTWKADQESASVG